MKETILNRRMVAFIIDSIIIGLLFGLYMYLITQWLVETELDYFSSSFLFAFRIGVAVLLICKDIFGGRSIGKIVRKLEIRDVKTGKKASIFKALLRNVPFVVLGPIEVMIGFVRQDNRRLGDLIAGTKVTLLEEVKPLCNLK